MSSVFNLPGWANAIAGDFFSGAIESLTGTKVIADSDAMILKMDPAGSARDVTLPAEAEVTPSGRMYWIINAADAAENLVIKDDGGATIATANQNESAGLQRWQICWCRVQLGPCSCHCNRSRLISPSTDRRPTWPTREVPRSG